MTEEIIIDCVFYKDGVCASPINKTCEYCKNIDVSKCYHKQLKRLEQENSELKEENKTAQKEYWKLEQGNDFLAEKIRLYRSALEEIREYCKNIANNNKMTNCAMIYEKINEVLNS